MATAHDKTSTNIDQLNSFLRGELSAVETYRIALDKLSLDSTARARLDACRQSHVERVEALRSKILTLGGKPAEGSGPWGAMTTAIATAAAALGDKAAIAALEQGEDHGLRDYSADLDNLAGDTRDLVAAQLLPRQQTTHRTMSDLKKELQ